MTAWSNSRRRIVAGFLVLSTTVLASGRDGGILSFGSDKAALGTVRKADLVQQVTVAGSLIPLRKGIIAPPYPGYIKKLYVKIGQAVRAGDPIVTLVPSLTGVTEEGFPLRAPFDGVVSQVLHTEGEYVDPAKDATATLLRIDDASRLFISSSVSETDIGKVKVGQPVLIKANAVNGRPYHGVIREIARAAIDKKDWSRSSDRVEFDVRMEVLDKDEQIFPGMSMIIDVITNKRQQVLTLPHEFIDKDGDNFFVTMATGEKRPVKVGLRNEESFEIVSGLKENDRVRQVDFFSKTN